LFNSLLWLGSRRASALYAPSEFLKRTVTRRHGVKCGVIRPAFEREKIDWDWSAYHQHCEEQDYLLFHGTVGRLKGVGVLVEALTSLLPRVPDLRLKLIGKDYTMGAGEGMATELIQRRLGEFGDRVKWLDRMPHSQLYPILSKARGSVLPSLIDNLPNTALEAMALGRVVIGTRGASFDELIEDGKSGLLVEVGDAEGLAAAMERLWNMPESERKAMGEAAKEVVAEFRPEKTIPILESYYREVIEEHQRRIRN
jgi:glycosyltransferase involved in cell wall biosynthesis